MNGGYAQIAVLLQSDELLSHWLDRVRRRSWTLRGREGQLLDVLRERCGHVLRMLAQATVEATAFEAGAARFREAVQSLAFTAGWMEGVGLAVTDAVALVHALEEVLGEAAASGPPIPHAFFEALEIVVSEAYCAALQQRGQARYRDAMEKSQLCALPHPRLPCLFLVGDPDLQALDDAIGRLMMLAVMCEARAVVIDGTGLFQNEPVMRSVLSLVLDESRSPPAHVVLCGAAPSLADEVVRSGASERVSLHEALAAALAEAAGCSELSWPR